MRKFIIAGAALALSAAPAFAQECTEELAEEKAQALFAMIEADPSKAENLEKYIGEVEEEYGGEPTPEQTCEALDKLIEKVEAGE